MYRTPFMIFGVVLVLGTGPTQIWSGFHVHIESTSFYLFFVVCVSCGLCFLFPFPRVRMQGHCFAEIPAILHNVSGEQENSCLMQINRGRGKSFGHLPFFNDIKCDHKLGRGRALSQPSLNFRAHPDTNILENTSMSQRIDAIPCKLCVVHSTTVMYTLVQEDGLGSMLGWLRVNYGQTQTFFYFDRLLIPWDGRRGQSFLVKESMDMAGRHAINTSGCVFVYGTHVCCMLMYWIL